LQVAGSQHQVRKARRAQKAMPARKDLLDLLDLPDPLEPLDPPDLPVLRGCRDWKARQELPWLHRRFVSSAHPAPALRNARSHVKTMKSS